MNKNYRLAAFYLVSLITCGAIFGCIIVGFAAIPNNTIRQNAGAVMPTFNATGAGYFIGPDMVISATRAATFTTLDTGQGANELYPMDQGVRTNDDVQFHSIDVQELNLNSVDVTDHVTTSLQRSYSYNIYSTDGVFYAANGDTGQIDYRGTDAVTVAQNALDQLTLGGELHFKNGTFVFTNSLWNQNLDYVTISGEGFSTVIKPDTVRESTLTAQANAGAGTLAVANGTQFKINQQIVCGTKDYTTVDKDWRRITNIVGNVLTLDSVLTFTHLNGAPVWTAYRCIESEGADGLIFENFKIDGNKANQYYYTQANAVCVGSTDKIFRVQNGVHLYQCNRATIQNIYTDSIAGWGGVVLVDSDYCIIKSCITENGVNHGIIIHDSAWGSISQCMTNANGGATTALGHGVCVEKSFYITIDSCTSYNNYGDGFYVYSTGGQCIVSNNVAYQNPIGINAGSVPGSIITGNTIRASSSVIGINYGIKTSNDAQITNNYIYIMSKLSGEGYGIYMTAGAAALGQTIVSGNKISHYPQGGSYFDPHSAIYMRGVGGNEAIVSNNLITGSYYSAGITYYASAQPYQNQKITDNVLNIATTPYGINIESTGVDVANSITDNIITGAATPIHFATAANEPRWNIRRNLGYVTENCGTETILNGTTSIVITHGLSYTPTSGNTAWTVSYLEKPTNDPGSWYIDTFTATQATIHVFRDPGISHLDIAWSARRTP